MSNSVISYIPLGDLNLDVKNPRLPRSLKEEDRSPEAIIDYMLRDASIIELMLAIGENGYFDGEALLVVRENGEYVVVEGNRRLTSLMLLHEPELATRHTSKVAKVLEQTSERPNQIPCVVFSSRDEILQYLGYRHVTGVKSWGVGAKARYLMSLLPSLSSQTLDEQCRELAKKIGSNRSYVKRLLVAQQIYNEIVDHAYFDIPDLDEKTLYFNYIVDSLNKDNITNHLQVKLDSDNPTQDLSIENLNELMVWFFDGPKQDRVLGNSRDLQALDKILGNGDSLAYFRDTKDLSSAKHIAESTSGDFTQQIMSAKQLLQSANSYLHKIPEHLDSDIDVLEEIRTLTQMMKAAIKSKSESADE